MSAALLPAAEGMQYYVALRHDTGEAIAIVEGRDEVDAQHLFEKIRHLFPDMVRARLALVTGLVLPDTPTFKRTYVDIIAASAQAELRVGPGASH
jgi:hypothetical protein